MPSYSRSSTPVKDYLRDGICALGSGSALFVVGEAALGAQ
jgi:hypothetical protein